MTVMPAAAEDIVLRGGDIEYSGYSKEESTKDAQVKGAALSTEDAVIIQECGEVTFSNNRTRNSYSSTHSTKNADLAAGGAVYGGTVTLSGNSGDITFTNNELRAKTTNDARTRVRGGAVKAAAVDISGNKGSTITFSGNKAWDDYKAWDATAGTQVDKPRFSCGGAVYADMALSISNNTGVAISFNNNEAGKGGALSAGYEGSIALTGNGEVSFSGNVAEYGGAVYTGAYIYKNNTNTAGNGVLSISGNSGVSFIGNSARNNGGAIYSQVNGRISISNNTGDVTFSGNSAALYGGAIRGQTGNTIELNANSGTVSFSGNKISRTDTTNVYGGAISVDNNSSISLNQNGKVELSGNSLKTNSSAYGGAVAVYNSALNINGNTGGVCIEDNTVTATKTSSWGSGVEACGGAVYGKNLTIQGNSGLVSVQNNVAQAVTDGAAKGGAFYVQNALTITGNQEVVFRGNVQQDPTQTILRSVYVESNTTNGSLQLSAAAGGYITFYDSLYAAPTDTSWSLTADFNKDSGATGTIVFSGKHAESDLKSIKAEASESEIEASRTSEVNMRVNLHQGSLSVQDGATLQSEGLGVQAGAALDMQSGTLRMSAAADLTLQTGSMFNARGSNHIDATTVAFADNTTFNLTLGAINEDTALITLKTDSLTYGSATLNFVGMASLVSGEYLLMDVAESATLAGSEWSTNGITINGLSEGDSFEWRDNGTRLYLVHTATIPEPSTATLSLLALAALAARRRRR